MRIRNKILFMTTLVVAFMILFAFSSMSATVYDSNNNKYLSTDDNVFYLPSHIKPNNVSFEVGDKVKNIDLTTNKTLDEKGNEVYKCDLFGESYMFYFANNLPSIYATTSMPLENILKNKNTRDEGVKLFITDKDGNNSYYDTSDTTSELKVRGNTTPNYKKQPFQIKLNKKHNLFGMGEAKTWILLANYLDQSNIRNSVMYKIGSMLGILTCEFQSVDLYLNGNYYGIYLLCEKVQINTQRVDIYDLEAENDILNPNNGGFTRKKTSGPLIDETIITEYTYVRNMQNPSDISGGYLIELDTNYYKDEKCYFKTSNGIAYVIKSPEYASQEQVEYIARVFAEMEEAIYSPTGKNSKGIHYSQYIDVESLAYGYILQEFGRNWDSGSSSLYFYKDRDEDGKFSKIVKGPLWDCDNTLGNMVKLRNGDPENNTDTFWSNRSKLWEGLLQHDYFKYVVAKEFTRIYPELIKMTEKDGFIAQTVSEIGTSIVMERARWNSDDYEFWPMYADHIGGVHYDDWNNGVQVFQFIDGKYTNGIDDDETTVIGYLNTFIKNRANWLIGEWIYNETDAIPSVSEDGIIDESLQLPIAPTFTPEYPNIPDKDTGTTTDTIIDTELNTDITDTETTTDSSSEVDNNSNSGDDNGMIAVIVAISVVMLLAIAGVLIVTIKLKKSK